MEKFNMFSAGLVFMSIIANVLFYRSLISLSDTLKERKNDLDFRKSSLNAMKFDLDEQHAKLSANHRETKA